MDKNKLYHKIDDDENLSDSEKREIYYTEIYKHNDNERNI
jgi:hypothetical protein